MKKKEEKNIVYSFCFYVLLVFCNEPKLTKPVP